MPKNPAKREAATHAWQDYDCDSGGKLLTIRGLQNPTEF
jgi:hypothetical protein